MENTKNIDALIESLQTENEALILVIEELVARLDEKLDPVGKEDKDVNNDGKVNRTDKYLLNRRKAIGNAIAKKKKVNEDVETLTGIKVPKRSTRKHMVQVAKSIANLRPGERPAEHKKAAMYFARSNPNFNAERFRKACNMSDGMERSDYVKEGVQQIDETSKAKRLGQTVGAILRGKDTPSDKLKKSATRHFDKWWSNPENRNKYWNDVNTHAAAERIKDVKHEYQVEQTEQIEETLTEKFKKVASEIRHLMMDKGYPQKRAVAAALQMKRAGKLEEDVFDSDESSAASRTNVKKAKRLLGANSPHAKALENLHTRMKDSQMYYGISDDEHNRRISDPEYQGEKPKITPMAAKGWSGYDAMTNLDRRVNLGAIPKAARAIKQTTRNPGYDPRAAQAIANASKKRTK